MTIVILHDFDARIEVLNVANHLVGEDVEIFLSEHGYSVNNITWIASGENSVPVTFHKYDTDETNTGEVHTARQHELKDRYIYDEVDYIKRREQEELTKAVRTHGKKVDGGFEVHFDENEPIIAGYLYDEPCDIVIKTVKVNEQGHLTILGEDKQDRGCALEIDINDFFAGQLDYVISEVGC